MFTGIVQDIGVVRGVAKRGDIYNLKIHSDKAWGDIGTGDSVAVNGACLTVTAKDEGVLNFNVMAETARNTNLIALQDFIVRLGSTLIHPNLTLADNVIDSGFGHTFESRH